MARFVALREGFVAGGFTFKLETLLKVRRRELQAAQRVVAERLRTIGGIESMIDRANEWIAWEYDQVRGALANQRFDARTMIRSGDYVASLRSQVEVNKNTLTDQRRVLASEREALVRASVNVKALEKLRERRLAEYRQQQERRERSAEDEAAVNGYLRSRNDVNVSGASWTDQGAVVGIG